MADKQRNYMYDAVRGFCMFLIPLQHFIGAGPYSDSGTFGGLIYITVDIFALQTFFFLSGMFSKKPERSREIAFKALLWPLLMSYVLFFILSYIRNGFDLNYALTLFKFGNIPYGMWFMMALFVYRMFQKNYVKIPHLFGLAFILYLISGCFGFLSKNFFAESRIITFFVSFLMGYYMTQSQVEKIRQLKTWQTVLLGAVLIGISVFVCYGCPVSIAKAIQLKASFTSIGLTWWQGILIRLGIFIVSFGWIVFLLNVMKDKKGFWSWIGMNTMPIYIFHLGFVGFFRKYGISFGLFDEKANPVLYYVVVFVVATVVSCVFASKPANKVYNWIMDGSYALFMAIINSIILPISGVVERGLGNAFNKMFKTSADPICPPPDVKIYQDAYEQERLEKKEARKQKREQKKLK